MPIAPLDNGTPTYQGEVMLLGWSENNRDGMTVRLALDGTDEGDAHPFRGLGTGKHGQRFMAVLVPVNDEGEAIAEQPIEKPRTPWRQKTRAQQAGIRCGEERFQRWLNRRYSPLARTLVADHGPYEKADALARDIICGVCGVPSRRTLDADDPGGVKWDALDAQYMVDTGQIAERTR